MLSNLGGIKLGKLNHWPTLSTTLQIIDLTALVYDMDDVLLLYCFITGLHPYMKREVKSICPIYLIQTVSLARIFEEKFHSHT